MMKIEYRKGDIFKGAPKDAILLHACNGQGVWGSGVAAQFASRFPHAKAMYADECFGNRKPGRGFILFDRQPIACIITSEFYGKRVDSPKMIAEATFTSVQDILRMIMALPYQFPLLEIHSPRINSGLFNTPWSKTRKAIERAYDIVEGSEQIKWVVWDL